MPISLFAPINPCTNDCSENLSFLRPATQLFNFGQKSYRITAVQGDKTLYLETIENKPTWLAVALRIAIIATVIIPLLAIAAIALYRLANQFQLKTSPFPFSKLPYEIQSKIYNLALSNSHSLAVTNKELNFLVKNDTALTKNKIVHLALERSLNAIKLMNPSQACEALCDIAKFLLPIDKERAQQLLNLALVKAKDLEAYAKKDALSKIAPLLARFDVNKALEISEAHYSVLARISIAISEDDEEKALEIADLSKDDKSFPLRHIAIARAKSDPEGAILMAKSLENFEIFFAFEGIIKIIVTNDPIRALELANEYMELADNMKGSRKNIVIERIIAAFYAEHNLTRAIALLDSRVLHNFEPYTSGVDVYAAISKQYAKYNLEEALEWVNSQLKGYDRLTALREITKTIRITNPEKALEITEDLLVAARFSQKKDHEQPLINCVGLIALFDLERALEIVDSVEDKIAALIEIIKARTFHPLEISKLAFRVFKECRLIQLDNDTEGVGHSYSHAEVCKIYLKLAKAFAH